MSLQTESEEEILWREALEALNHMIEEDSDLPEEGQRVALVDVVALLGDRSWRVELKELAKAMNPDLTDEEMKGFNRKLARVLRTNGCLVKKIHGRSIAFIPCSKTRFQEELPESPKLPCRHHKFIRKTCS